MRKVAHAFAAGLACVLLAEDHPLLAIALFVLITWQPKEQAHV
ncbi:hypothetical protein [Pseudomonas sp. HMWF032]|nr:hypothetical protein [Pseudomonas sp. HMWF032]